MSLLLKRNKTILLSLFLVLTTLFSYSQEFGLMAGVNYSKYKNETDIFGGKWRTSVLEAYPSYLFGAYAASVSKGNHNIKAELFYMNTRVSYLKNESIFTNSLIVFPLFYIFNKGKFVGEVGPEINYFVNEVPYNGRLNFAANLGVGVKLTNNLLLGLRYNKGLSNIQKGSIALHQKTYTTTGLLYLQYSVIKKYKSYSF